MTAASDAPKSRRWLGVLDPSERVAEMLFGLIMVLTITGALSASEAARDDVRTMLAAALGCNIAWGIIDGVLYLMGRLAERGSNLAALHAVRRATDPRDADARIVEALPKTIGGLLRPDEVASLRERLLALPEPPPHARLSFRDYVGALGVFLLVFLSTFPVALPFIFIHDAALAIHVSNAIAIAMLFLLGVAFGRHAGRSPLGFGVAMVIVGLAMVCVAIALGG